VKTAPKRLDPARLSAASCRAARALLKWSMRDLAAAADVSLPTLLKIEKGGEVGEEVSRKVQTAFLQHHVSLHVGDGFGARLLPSAPGRAPLDDTAALIRSLPFVSARRRTDGTYRVLFEVPGRLRPAGWLPTTPIPFHERRGDLGDRKEVVAIRRDAGALYQRYRDARVSERERS
jgi:transcriptional regulator with XRE-family HTH domain